MSIPKHHWIAHPRLAMFGLLLGLLGAEARLNAQTAWEAAPATPAVVPGLRSRVPAKLVNLPPPPSANGSRIGSSFVSPDSNHGLPPVPGPGPALGVPGNGPHAGLPPLPDPSDLPFPGTPTRTPNRTATETKGLGQPSRRPGPAESLVSMGGQPTSPQLADFQPGELIAVVGTDHILAGDMNVFIEPIIDQNRDRIRNEEQEAVIRVQLTRQVLKQYVEVKALYQEFFRDMVGTASPKELADMEKQVVTKAGKIFFERQVPTLYEKYKVNDMLALEEKLREKSVSLVTLRTQFIEQVLSGELERKYVPEDFEIDSEEILRHYREHRADWEVPARRRWRQLTIRHDQHDSREAASQLIRQLGDEIYLGGKPFEAVARQASEGFTAADGGAYDWTSKGSLKSDKLDQAIFTLPIRYLSQVIEDEIGFHIIQVLEREEAHTKDLAVSQAEIRKVLSDEKREKAASEFRQKVMKRTPIWTLWPEDIPGSRPLSQALGKFAT